MLFRSVIDLKVKGTPDNVKMDVAFAKTDRIFITSPNNPDIKINVTVSSANIAALKGKLNLIVKSDFNDSISTQSMMVELGKNSAKMFSFMLKGLKPGFYNAVTTLESPSTNNQLKFSFGVDPEKIISPTDQQPDFANYWDRAKKELAAVEPQYNLILVRANAFKTTP